MESAILHGNKFCINVPFIQEEINREQTLKGLELKKKMNNTVTKKKQCKLSQRNTCEHIPHGT